MNNANTPKSLGRNTAQTGTPVGLDQGIPRVPSPNSKPITMRDLGLKHLEYPANPHAKMLADTFAPKILAMLKAGKYAQQAGSNTAQENRTEEILTPWQEKLELGFTRMAIEASLTAEDREALEEMPL